MWPVPLPPLRDNARSLQPRGGPDHPRVRLPGSDGGPVLFRGPAHEGQEQTQAQETPHQTAHVPPAAAATAADDWENPHSLTGTVTLSCCWGAGFPSRNWDAVKRTTCVEQQHRRCGITRSLMNCRGRRVTVREVKPAGRWTCCVSWTLNQFFLCLSSVQGCPWVFVCVFVD